MYTLSFLAWVASAVCLHSPALAVSPPAALSASAWPPSAATPSDGSGRARKGLMMVLTACWYDPPPGASAADPPNIDPARCRSVGHRAITDLSRLEDLNLVEQVTLENLITEFLDGEEGP